MAGYSGAKQMQLACFPLTDGGMNGRYGVYGADTERPRDLNMFTSLSNDNQKNAFVLDELKQLK